MKRIAQHTGELLRPVARCSQRARRLHLGGQHHRREQLLPIQRVELLQRHLKHVKTGVPGVAYLRLDPQVEWPEELAIKVPQ